MAPTDWQDLLRACCTVCETVLRLYTQVCISTSNFWNKYSSCSIIFSQVDWVTESLGNGFVITQQVRGRTGLISALYHKPPNLYHEALGRDYLGYPLQLLHELPREPCQIKPIRTRTAFPSQFKKHLLNVCSMSGVIYLWFCNVCANSA